MKFCSTTVSFLEDALLHGKYLGLSIDVGPTMTAKILTPTDKIVHCSTYRPLMPEELVDLVKQDPMKDSLQKGEEWWGTHLVKDNLSGLDSLTHQTNNHTWLTNKQTRYSLSLRRRGRG